MDSINIDVKMPGLDDSITSVKDLRAKINELKDSLVTLDSGTQEYSETVQELTQYTSKLQEVQSAGKQTVDSLPGSYNELNNQMKDLLKQYKSMSVVTDEDKKKQEELAAQINSMNDELKALDAAVGNHQREVGNYANALHGLRDIMDTVHTGTEQLGDGFNAVGSIIGSVTGETSSVSSAMEAFGSTFESLTGVAYSLYDSLDKVQIMYEMGSEVMEIFKGKQAAATAATEADSVAKKANTVATAAETTATNAATVATKGLTKALLSNPFTLIAVAVVALIANLDTLVEAFHKVVDWITGFNEKMAEEEKATNRVIAANEKLIASQDERSKQFEREIKIMKAQGASAIAIINARLKENHANRLALRGQIELTAARIADLRVLAAQDDRYQKQLDAAIKSMQNLNKTYHKLKDNEADLLTDRKVAEIEAAKQAKETASSRVKSSTSANKQIVQNQVKTVEELRAEYKKDVENFKDAIEQKVSANTSLDNTYRTTLGYIKQITRNYEQNFTSSLSYISEIQKKVDSLNQTQKVISALRLSEQKKIKDQIEEDYAEQEHKLRESYENEQKLIKENSKYTEKERNRRLQASSIEYKERLDQLAKYKEDAMTLISKDNLKILDNTDNLQDLQAAENVINQYREAVSGLNDAYSKGLISEEEYINGLKEFGEQFNKNVKGLNIDSKDSPLKEAMLATVTLTPEEEEQISTNISNAGQKILDKFKSTLADTDKDDSTVEPKNKNDLVLQAFGLKSTDDIDKSTDNIISKLQENQQKLKDFINSDDFKILTPEQQAEILQQLYDTTNQLQEQQNKKIEDNAKKTVSTIQGVYKGAMSGLSGLGDLFQAKMDLAKTKADKIKKDTSLTEEQQKKLLDEQQKEYNKAFEANKKVQIAQTTISTLQSAMEAYKAMAGIPIVGPALGAAAAGVALATGYMQIKQIKATTPDSLSDSSSDTSSSVTNTIDVNALLNRDQESNELNNDYLTTLQGQNQSKQKTYVLQSEIDDTHNKMKSQIQQSSF